MTKMAAMPIYGKNFKKSLLWNQMANDLETWYAALDARVLATDDRNDKKFLLSSKLCPLGVVCPQPQGYIHVLNYENNCLKSDFKEVSLQHATNG